MIRYLLTLILMIAMFIIIIVIAELLVKILYLASSVSNYALVIINGTRGLLGIS